MKVNHLNLNLKIHTLKNQFFTAITENLKKNSIFELSKSLKHIKNT